ncbi:hypothetical protein BDFB_012483 [Asbolus verrucosus]|uniref:Uncharacterized protein n=1 Tax=Asbolus verrucosus TaxID=1661398 RepID=A0A482W383_ASBVE|nr:hypothetical protein BDFB_012483 [Asbolus verrucosus]
MHICHSACPLETA